MATRSPAKSSAASVDVYAFVEALDHAHKAAIHALRGLIQTCDPRIVESIKWNAPSFAIGEHFATLKLMPKSSLQVVLHTGARTAPSRLAVEDPTGMLKWAAPDRAVATFVDAADVERRGAAFAEVVRAWIAATEPLRG
jgi:hypothetical protein